jgi:hypothetical protein
MEKERSLPTRFDTPVEFDIRLNAERWKNRYSVADRDSAKGYRHELVLQGNVTATEIVPLDRNGVPLPIDDCDTQIYVFAGQMNDRSLGTIRYNPPVQDSPQFISLSLHGMPSLSDFLAKHIVSGRLDGLTLHITTAPNDAIDIEDAHGKLVRAWRIERAGELSILSIDVTSS